MVGNLNKVTLIGNVGRDPEIRTTQDGREVANILLATSESWKSKATGERKERTEWHRIVIFSDGLVNITKNYIHKGAKLYIEGTLQTRKWVDSNNNERFTTEIVLQGYNSNLFILDSKSHGSSSSSSFKESTRSEAPDAGKDSLIEELDDEIPF